MKNFGENHVQKGCVVVIKKKPKKSKLRGFTVGSTHVIQKPPKGYLNSNMSVWLKATNGKVYPVQFQYFLITNRKIK